MPDPVLDPSLPADHSPLVAAEMRNQFQAIHDRFATAAQVELLRLLAMDCYCAGRLWEENVAAQAARGKCVRHGTKR